MSRFAGVSEAGARRRNPERILRGILSVKIGRLGERARSGANHRVKSTLFMLASSACNAYNECMQYTIRNVPDTLDGALRRAAREQGKSLNEMAIEALARGAGITGERSRQRDLNDIAGTWRKDPAFESALHAQDTIDEKMWK